MARRRFLLTIAVIATLVFVLSALPVMAQGQPKKGGTLKVISTGGDVRCIGYAPDVRLLYQMIYSQPVTETLLRWDKKGELAPHLAESWRFSPDLKAIILNLRKGVKFHDGTDFDAEAVKFNFEVYQKSGRPELEMVTSIDTPDRHTVRLNLKDFNNLILTNLTMNVGIMTSPAALKKSGVDEVCRNPVGTGPFRFKNWQRDLSIRFERFEGYWQKGKPYLDAFEWLHIKDPMTAVSAFMAGDADAIINITPPLADKLRKDGQYEIFSVPFISSALVGDSGNPNSPFAKLKVRQAVSHAIDAKAIVDSVHYGFAEVTNQFSSPRSWGYNKNVVGYPYDPKKARQLLAEAGYPNGFKSTLWWSNIGIRPQTGAALQAYLREVGIDVEVKLLELSAWNDKLRAGWDGLMFTSISNSVPDDSRSGFIFSNCKASLWKSVACIKEMEDHIQKVITARDFKGKVELFQEYNKLLVDKHALMNCWVIESNIAALKKYVKGSDIYGTTFIQFNPADAYLDK
jgi:peptide/nickel transport system substrate-binding protein